MGMWSTKNKISCFDMKNDNFLAKKGNFPRRGSDDSTDIEEHLRGGVAEGLYNSELSCMYVQNLTYCYIFQFLFHLPKR